MTSSAAFPSLKIKSIFLVHVCLQSVGCVLLTLEADFAFLLFFFPLFAKVLMQKSLREAQNYCHAFTLKIIIFRS